MRVSKLEEYKKMDEIALAKELKELKKELFKLRFSHAMNGLDNPNKLNEAKKNIARANTILTMKKMGLEVKTREVAKPVKKTVDKKTKEEPKKEKKEKIVKETKKVGGKN